MRLVEGVEMQTRHAGFEKFSALLSGVFDAKRCCRFVIVLQVVQALLQRRRDPCAAHGGESFDLGCGQNRNNAGTNWDRDPEPVAQMIPEFKKVGVVEKKLCENEVSAGVDLFLQMLPVGILAFSASHVAFGKTGGADG